MSFVELTRDEARSMMGHLQAAGSQLSEEVIMQVAEPIAHVTAGVLQPTRLFRRKLPVTIELTTEQADILLRIIEDSGVLLDESRREEAREKIRGIPWSHFVGQPGFSLIKKLAHCAAP